MALLRELFNFDQDSVKTTHDPNNDLYMSRDDDSPVKYDDTRKTKLTLRAINKIRKASDHHQTEVKKDLEFVRQMYKSSGAEEAI